MKKYKISLLLIAALIFFLTGLSIYLNCQREEQIVNVDKIILEDSAGRKVEVPCPPKRIVTLNSDAAELICAFGEEERIAGVTNSDKFPLSLNQKPRVGLFNAPSLEKILSLQPDLVIAYSSSIKSQLVQQMNRSGIPVILLDCYKLDSFKEDVSKLGRILQKENSALEYVAMFDNYLQLVKNRTEKIPEEKRKRVYIEAYSDYCTVNGSKGNGAAQMVEIAGGINIARDMPNVYTQISPEWVVTQNPDAIIKGAGSKIVSGYHKDYSSMKNLVNNIKNRVGWDKIQAVKTGSVYIVSADLWTGPRQVIGIIYIAKWLYPELFRDLNPLEIHGEFLDKYFHCDAKGAWAYPD